MPTEVTPRPTPVLNGLVSSLSFTLELSADTLSGLAKSSSLETFIALTSDIKADRPRPSPRSLAFFDFLDILLTYCNHCLNYIILILNALRAFPSPKPYRP